MTETAISDDVSGPFFVTETWIDLDLGSEEALSIFEVENQNQRARPVRSVGQYWPGGLL